MKLSNSFRGAVRQFAYKMAVGHPELAGMDYLHFFGEEPSAIEQCFAIFANVIEMDENGEVLNGTYAERRATDYIKEYCDSTFKPIPTFEYWEVELHPANYPWGGPMP